MRLIFSSSWWKMLSDRNYGRPKISRIKTYLELKILVSKVILVNLMILARLFVCWRACFLTDSQIKSRQLPYSANSLNLWIKMPSLKLQKSLSKLSTSEMNLMKNPSKESCTQCSLHSVLKWYYKCSHQNCKET